MAKCDACAVTGETKIFVLLDVPEVEDKAAYLMDYLECSLSEHVDCVNIHADLPHRALISMTKKIDLKNAARLISRHKFEEQTLTLEASKSGNILIIHSSCLNKSTLYCVKHYFQKEFAEGQEVISCCLQIPQSKTYAISFNNREVMERVLTHKVHHVIHKGGSFDVVVEPFYVNFHGHVPFENKLLYQAFEQMATNQKDTLQDISSFKRRVNNENSAFIVSDSKEIRILVNGGEKNCVKKTPMEVLRINEQNNEQQIIDRLSDDSSSRKASMECSNVYFSYLSYHHKQELCEALKSVESFVNSGWNKTVIYITGKERAVRKATIMMEHIHRSVGRELQYVKTLLETGAS